jgi:flagellar secretion chaperone FliS
MSKTATESYFVTEVLTATPQKRQLLLIEAAIRGAEAARRHWRAGENEPAFRRLLRAQQIVGEIIASLDYETPSDFVSDVAGVYLFIYRSLIEAASDRDENKLDDALRVLDMERETWRQICHKFGGKVTDEPAEAVRIDSKSSIPAPTFDSLSDFSATGISLEA